MKTAEFGPAGTAGLTDYEILRQKNISRNAKLLEDLNLKHEFAAMLPLPDTPKEKQVRLVCVEHASWLLVHHVFLSLFAGEDEEEGETIFYHTSTAQVSAQHCAWS